MVLFTPSALKGGDFLKRGSNALVVRDRIEERLIDRIDRRAEEGRHNEEHVQPVRVAQDGARTWQF